MTIDIESSTGRGVDMSKKHLGKIVSAKFGIAGYQDAMIGFHVHLSFDGGCGTMQERSAWSPSHEVKLEAHRMIRKTSLRRGRA